MTAPHRWWWEGDTLPAVKAKRDNPGRGPHSYLYLVHAHDGAWDDEGGLPVAPKPPDSSSGGIGMDMDGPCGTANWIDHVELGPRIKHAWDLVWRPPTPDPNADPTLF